ncbi:MAG: oligosaccharide flippase family protein, partial [Hyphomicrobiales bacterium]|nr:oligosaccharide flippase family protein [Hyphomicrobiales bacterium]
MPQKPWRQLAFVLGEAALALLSGGFLYVLISRISGPELLGVYALALAWLMLFQGISSFGIPEFILREAGAHGRDAAGQVVHALLLGLGSGIAAICLMLAVVNLLAYSPALTKPISVASLALIPAFLNTACRSVFVARRQMHVPFLAALIEVGIMVSVSPCLLLSGYGAIALMITLVAAKVMSASIEITLLFRWVFPAPPALELGVLLKTARAVFAFGIGAVVGMLATRINVILVSLWVSIETVGHYAAATKIMEFCLIGPAVF